MWNINDPQGRIPCAIFTKFAEFVPRVSFWPILYVVYREAYDQLMLVSRGNADRAELQRFSCAPVCIASR